METVSGGGQDRPGPGGGIAHPVDGAGRDPAVYEVFGQPQRGDAFVHCGSLVAGDPQVARLLAVQLYSRRQEYVCLWVVPRQHILVIGDGDSEWCHAATDKTYRLGEGFARTRLLWQRFGRVAWHERTGPEGTEPARGGRARRSRHRLEGRAGQVRGRRGDHAGDRPGEGRDHG
ncbi:MAG: phenylacetic acid degradation protein PaaB [Bacillota bacterium]